VKKNHWFVLTIGIAIVLGIYAVPAITQQAAAPQASQTPFYVAVIDVAQVMRMHPHFMEEQGKLKAQIDQAEAVFKQRQEGIEGKRRALEGGTFRPGTQEYQQQFDIIANEMADFERDARTLQRRFALANSQIMFDTYQDIKKTIGAYATARGIAQVTDYREFTPDPAIPETVAEDMDQRLVWFNPTLNLTKHIIGEVYAARGLPMPTIPPPGQPVQSANQGQQPVR